MNFRETDQEVIDLQSLKAILGAVNQFPISSQEVALKARRLNSPQNVINFFESIPGGTVFQDQQDLLDRSITAEILTEEKLIEPPEHVQEGD
jgi:hypothetical protein